MLPYLGNVSITNRLCVSALDGAMQNFSSCCIVDRYLQIDN